jgi:hypothetical protein
MGRSPGDAVSADTFAPLDYALALRALGLSVFPIPGPVSGTLSGRPGDGKTPAKPWKRWQTERADERQISEWFKDGDQNIAIVCGGVSGIVVVDTDDETAERWAEAKLPRTPWRTKTAKGMHRFYQHPGAPVRNRARRATRDGRIALDVRSDGGFVIGPGSRHASGARYTALGNWTVSVAKLPRFWPGWIARPERQPAPRPAQRFESATDVVRRARAYLQRIPPPVIGQGSDAATFFAACRLLRGFALDAETTLALLVEWSPADFDREWIARKVESAERYGEETIGGLR